jgi:hypothetical protein
MIVEGKSGRPSRSADQFFAFSRLPRGEKIGTSNAKRQLGTPSLEELIAGLPK